MYIQQDKEALRSYTLSFYPSSQPDQSFREGFILFLYVQHINWKNYLYLYHLMKIINY